MGDTLEREASKGRGLDAKYGGWEKQKAVKISYTCVKEGVDGLRRIISGTINGCGINLGQ